MTKKPQHNIIVVLEKCVIPPFDDVGQLPAGAHKARWDEFQKRFGTTSWRQTLLSGMERMLRSLKKVGCKRVFMDGSFVSSKQQPIDYDGCWDRAGVDLALLRNTDPVLLDFRNGRAAQKLKYRGEMFPADAVEGTSGTVFLEFFSKNKDTGDPKGIVVIDLGDIT